MSDQQDATMIASSASQPPPDSVLLNHNEARKTPPILRLSQELLDEIAVSVASGGYHIENCLDTCFAPKEWIKGGTLDRPASGHIGPSAATKTKFGKYKTSKRTLLSMILSCKALSASARRLVYQQVSITKPQQLILLLRTLAIRPDLRRQIKRLELSCKLDERAETQAIQDLQFKAWTDVATTSAESFPWLKRLRKHWSTQKKTYEHVLTLLYLALLYSTPALKTLYLCFRPGTAEDPSSWIIPQIRPSIKEDLESFTKSGHVVLPELEQVYVSTAGQGVCLEYLSPLLALGKPVTKLTVHNSLLTLVPHFEHMQASVSVPSSTSGISKRSERNMLQNIRELTLDDFSLSADPTLYPDPYTSFEVFVHAKNVRVLRIGDHWSARRFRPFSRQTDFGRLLGFFLLPPSFPALEYVDVSRVSGSGSGTSLASAQFMNGLRRVMRHSRMATLRVSLKGMFGDYSWLGKGHPVRDSPGGFLSRLVVPEDHDGQVPMFPPPAVLPAVPGSSPLVFSPSLTKLILVVTEGGRPKSCGTLRLSEWKPWDRPVTGGRKWSRVQVCQVLRECAPWLDRVDVCVVKGPCGLH